MILTVRSVVTSLAVGFAIYFAARAVWWTVQPTAPLILVLAIAVYLATIIAGILAETPGRTRMPAWAATLAILSGLVIPTLVSVSLEPEDRVAPFATWYIGALGVTALICIVRRRLLAGWLVIATLAVASTYYLGFGVALSLGLVGSVTWVAIAQLLVIFWDRAVKDTERLAGIQQAVSAWHSSQQMRQKERRMRVQFALTVAGPVLSRVIETHGALDDAERLQARLAEGRLRDELRGASLMNDAVRAAIEGARRRGALVTVFAEQGLAGMSTERSEEIRVELADIIANISTERVIIRGSQDPRVAVTVVGRARGGDEDEDSAAVLHEILRSR